MIRTALALFSFLAGIVTTMCIMHGLAVLEGLEGDGLLRVDAAIGAATVIGASVSAALDGRLRLFTVHGEVEYR